jgi:hypothetical protein
MSAYIGASRRALLQRGAMRALDYIFWHCLGHLLPQCKDVFGQLFQAGCQLCALVLIVVYELELAVEEAEMDLWCRPRRSEGQCAAGAIFWASLGPSASPW